MPQRVLIIDDDVRLCGMLGQYLEQAGYTVVARHTAGDGLAEQRRSQPDAIILDLMLPDASGLDICTRLRTTSQVPIIMLTARGEATDRVVGLELGADDYLPKPFEPRELLARLRTILRRGGTPPLQAALRFGRLEIDREARRIRIDGEDRALTAYQFDLLLALAERAGRVVTRSQLLDAVAGRAPDAFDRSIDVHVSNIRAAIEDDPKQPRRILTLRGAGYLFARNQDEEPNSVIRHLYLRIYLSTLGALAVVVALCALLWEFITQRQSGMRVVSPVHVDAMQVHLHGLGIIVLIALAVAAAMYPLVRRLTRQLESLTVGVDRFGQGDLASRVMVSGNDEVSRLAASFNTMADRVSHLLDAHARMLANASHELRSPLARIQMALALYENAPRPDLLQGIRHDCSEIEEQVADILLASKLDTVAPPLREAVDMGALLAEECARLALPFEVEPAEVIGDTRLLRRLLRNLLENAIRHGGVDVRAQVTRRDGMCVLQVSDRGPGIAAADRERIFEPFYRPANSAETGSGWGLGLALVRQIANLHHGTIRCLDRAQGGCTFELTLPAQTRR